VPRDILCPIWGINSYCLHGQNGSPYIAHVVRVYRHILLMWSACSTICCINSCCSHGQHVAQYIAHVVRVPRHILRTNSCCPHCRYVSPYIATWSVCITIYCPRGQCVSQYIAHRSVCPAIYCAPIHAVYMVGMCHHILPTWSVCITIYCPPVRVPRHILRTNSCRLHGRHVSPYIAHVVRVYHDILCQFILST
jgi:hypothetical protein